MTTEQYSIGYDAGYQDGFDAALADPVKQEPVAWMHSCNALCTDGLELWVDQCPHCGKPRTTTTPTAAQAARDMRDAAVNVCFTTDECNILELRQHIADTIAALPIIGEDK